MDNHRNSKLFLRYAQTPLFQGGSPVSRIGLLDPTKRLGLRGGFEMACNDPDIYHLHALRIGLCVKIEQGSIRRNLAIDIFDQAYNYVIEKARKEQKIKDLKPGHLQVHKK